MRSPRKFQRITTLVVALVTALAAAAPASAADSLVTGTVGTQLTIAAVGSPAGMTLTKGGANVGDSTVSVTGIGSWTLRAYEASGDGKLSRTVPSAYTLTNPLQVAFSAGAGASGANVTGSATGAPSYDGTGVALVPVSFYQSLADADLDDLDTGQVLTATVTYDLIDR